ncbi:hypothetical protein HYPGJ_10300 [Hyphomicrobium sp. GJ21]|nr:hypothetical protein HYPGJ_10300 [Hyphomicrobium sp. GJ21]
MRVGSRPPRASLSGHGRRGPIRLRRKAAPDSVPTIFGGGHAAAPHLDGIATIRVKAGLRQRATRRFPLRLAGTTPLFEADPGFNPGLAWGQPSWGPLREACGQLGFASLMTPAATETHRAPVERG